MRTIGLRESARRHGLLAVLGLGLVGLALCAGRALHAQGAGDPGYVGARACVECHAAVNHRWSSGRHSKMLQPATPEAVKGDFSLAAVELRGRRYGLSVRDGRYFIDEPDAQGRRVERRLDFTLGSRRIQHYLSRQQDGRIVVLAPTWDVERRQWFHNMEIVRPDEKHVDGVQVWNKNCDGCHVSRQSKNFDPETLSYATEWQDFGTSCERCHGPGSAHGLLHAKRPDGTQAPATAGQAIVHPGKLDARRATEICAQCHSLRDVVVAGYQAGGEYYDHFLPILEYGPRDAADPAWWPDGRPRRFSNDALGFWQSRCYLEGKATCVDCHSDPHEPDVDKNPGLSGADGGLCARCHQRIVADAPAHTRHPAGSPGSACVECHMPRTVFSIKASIRDHTLSVPAPENSARFGIPNACGSCHKGKPVEWAVAEVARWGPGEGRRRLAANAEAFSEGRARKPAAAARLAAIAARAGEGPLVRANALGHLAGYRTHEAQAALLGALASDEPLLRAVAVLNLGGYAGDAAVRAGLVAALRDARRVVRASAGLSLVGAGVVSLPGEDGARLEAAKADYVARARFHADDAEAQLELGKFLLLSARFAEAQQALLLSRRLDAGRPVDYFLALADVGQGRLPEARERLRRISPADPNAPAARSLLGRLASGPGSGR